MNEDYNGWSNRETWATALHIGNDSSLYEIAREYIEATLEAHPLGKEEREIEAGYYLAETLKNWIEEDLLTLENIAGNQGLWLMLTDIGSLYRVNWREIAESYISEMKLEEESA
jgi:hypothetical protein